MSIKYSILSIKKTREGEERHYAKAVYGQTIDSKQLEREIQYSTTLTPTDIKACLSALSAQIKQHLKDGDSIHLEGIGYLKVSLQCLPEMNPERPSGRFVEVKSVRFRPEKQLLNDLKDTPFVLAKDHRRSAEVTEDELMDILKNYFESHAFLRRSQLQSIAHLTKEVTCIRLRKLVEKGVLRKEGPRNAPIYLMNR